MNYVNINGKIQAADEPVFLASNRGYRYGDGLFETMKLSQGNILLGAYHFDRLFSGLSLLQYEVPKLFTKEKLKKEITLICEKNNYFKLTRVRLSVFRGNGGLHDEDKSLQYMIECWPLPESVNKLNENGLVIDIYKEIRKATGVFSNIKSANFLPYTMAALFAKENKLNDCLVINTSGNVADSTIANVFIIKQDTMITPALTEGCINGVMRRFLIEKMKEAGYKVEEATISEADLLAANEIFLTNAVNGIRWVKQFRQKTFTNQKTTEIYNHFLKTIGE